ncbi:hypothetical protein [Gemmatimonas sp.]|uniref:hypothetical protein n=1 Tax=Gemmatimonas sp. TaxID=1962908 RepID=UPI003982F74A
MTVSTTHFVNSLRVRPEIIRLASEQAPVLWTVRVQAAEVWDAVRVEATPETPVRDVKQAAMALLLPDVEQIDSYVVKLYGADVPNEAQSLQSTGARDASTLFVTSRRRRPVR